MVESGSVGTVKSQRRTRGTFMSVLSNESFSHQVCAEVTLPFSAVAQRLRIGGYKYETNHWLYRV